MDFEQYNQELSKAKVELLSEKLKNELLHRLEMKADFASFFESKKEKNILLEFEEDTNLIELENYEKELNDKFWN